MLTQFSISTASEDIFFSSSSCPYVTLYSARRRSQEIIYIYISNTLGAYRFDVCQVF